jgi:hypothetical protein
MMWMASTSRAWRISVSGHPCPTMCSLRFSPVPTPRKKRPGIMAAAVAAGLRDDGGMDPSPSGQVTAVPSRSRFVACAIAPITLHTNGLWPWRSIHG